MAGNLGGTWTHSQEHAFTVRDDIAMVRFNDPSALEKSSAARFSPDGRYFAVVTSKGLLESDRIESVLSIFRTDQCRAFLVESRSAAAPRPIATIKMATMPNIFQDDTYGPVILDARWSFDSRFVLFLAEGPRYERRLYRLDVGRDSTVPISPAGYSVVRFDFNQDVIVFSAWHSDSTEIGNGEDGNKDNSDSRTVTGQSLWSLLFPKRQPVPTDRSMWTVRDFRRHPKITPVAVPPVRDISWQPEAYSISPQGHEMIQLQPVTAVGANWDLYEPAKGFDFMRIRRDDPDVQAADNSFRLKEYTLVSLGRGNSTTLVHAPQASALVYGGGSKVVWSSDERRVLLTNTFLPLDGIDDVEREKRRAPCAVAEVQLSSDSAHCVVSVPDLTTGDGRQAVVENASFGRLGDEVMIEIRSPQGGGEVRRFQFRKDHWEPTRLEVSVDGRGNQVADGSEARKSLSVIVKQGLNESPTLWVTDSLNGRSKMLWDPNPQFRNINFGQASIYRWTDGSGRRWKGGLVKPVGYTAGKRYPLVIQVYNFGENQFLTDGMVPTAMAARELASAGMVVLQVQRIFPHTYNDAEAQAHIEGFRGAIEQLSSEGLIDADKVGLIGFSATAWYVEDALIRDPKRFAAATIADGIDISYLQYRLWGVSSPALAGEFEKIIGAKPIGDGLTLWCKLAPGFHLDAVQAPLRVEAIGPYSILSEWELYSSLRQEGKPVDLIYFPEGQHIHQRPQERLASQQGDVDWFRFWLQGLEDPDPSKREQYRAWEKMRDLESRSAGSREGALLPTSR
jgi:dipeptidyl aminopeptidase/acylaminoacyl peptidase